MQRDIVTLLDDILKAINEIEFFLINTHNLEQYKKDILRKRAVERNLEVVGEVVKKIPQIIKNENKDIEWRQIAGLRDFIAHGYFEVDDEIIWNTVEEHLQPFKERVIKIRSHYL